MAKAKQNKDEDILRDLGINDEPDEGEGDGKVKKAKDDDPVAKLNARLDALEKENQRLSRANASLMSATGSSQGTQPKPPEKPKGVDLSGLPDPTEDPEKYHKALNERINSAMDAYGNYVQQSRQSQEQSEATRQERLSALWEDFSESHPELADKEDIVSFAAQNAVKRAQRKGLDVDKYMFVNSEVFFDDVTREVERVKKQFGDDQDTGKDKDQDEDDLDTARTAGIFGGQESGGKPNKGKGQDKPGSLIEELQAIQKKEGFL